MARLGLSPHARGNLRIGGHECYPQGPIPACTGEPVHQANWRANSGAYPRMHGGTSALTRRSSSVAGLSPHARGNPGSKGGGGAKRGPIPACTGEPLQGLKWDRQGRAYPRMHGGTSRS